MFSLSKVIEGTFQDKAGKDEYYKYKDEVSNTNSKEMSDDEKDSSDENYDYDDYGDDNDYDASTKGKFIKKVTRTYMNAPAQHQPSNVNCWLGVEYIPHSTDCTQFYHCANGKPFLKTCSFGLYFNPKLNVCDWPYNVDCGSGTQVGFVYSV